MNYKYLFLIVTATVFFSCKGEEPDTPEPVVSSISVSEKTLELPAEMGSTVSVDVITDGDWGLEGMGDGVRQWLEASVLEGHGSASVTFTATEFNPYDEERMAVLTFRCGEAVAPVVIRQTNDPARSISLSAENLAFAGPEGEELTLDVLTSKPWTLEGYTDEVKTWLDINAVSGETAASLTFKSLTRNLSLADREVDLEFRIDRVHSAFVHVSQKTGLVISASSDKLEFPSDEAASKTLVISTNTDQYPWHVEGYTDEVKAWLSIDPVTFSGKEKTVTVSTLGANEGSSALSAELVFCLSEEVRCSVTFTQEVPVLKTFVISWKGSNSYNHVIKGGDQSPHTWFPWIASATTVGSLPDFLNGKDGETVSTGGNYTKTGTWLFKDSVTAEWVPLEMGPIREVTGTARVYYMNHGNDNLRWCGAYIKIPAMTGYRLSHVYMSNINGAAANTISLSKEKQPTQDNSVEGYFKVSWGKANPFDVELTNTEAGVDYYISSYSDRWMDSFVFTYTEVR